MTAGQHRVRMGEDRVRMKRAILTQKFASNSLIYLYYYILGEDGEDKYQFLFDQEGRHRRSWFAILTQPKSRKDAVFYCIFLGEDRSAPILTLAGKPVGPGADSRSAIPYREMGAAIAFGAVL